MNGLKEMAIEAGMHYRELEDEFCKANADGVPMEMLEKFAQLLARHVRAQLIYGSRDAWVLEEREACAKVCESLFDPEDDTCDEAEKCAKAIRARGEA